MAFLKIEKYIVAYSYLFCKSDGIDETRYSQGRVYTHGVIKPE